MQRRSAISLILYSFAGATAIGLSPAAAFNPPTQDLLKVTVGMLEFGTAQWEMKIIKDNKLDEKFGIDLQLMNVAGKPASHVALMSGEADVVLSDFLWVASLRAQGEAFTLVPHSFAVGGLIVDPSGPISALADLPGKTIGVAGGPVDKSWVALQAYYQQQTGDTLADKVDARFGAPPLINELLTEGSIDASLNFWHWNARAKAAGMQELVSVSDMMGAMGVEPEPPLLGWVFRDEVADEKTDAIVGFLNASFAAKDILLNDDAAWETLRGKMRANDNDALFTSLRDDYRAGILTSYDDGTLQAAEELFNIMAEIGGTDLVGDSMTMDPGTFWAGYRK